MEVEVHDGFKSSTLLSLVRADGLHLNGGTQIDRHTDKGVPGDEQQHGAPGRGRLRHHQRPVRRQDLHHGHDVLRHQQHRQGPAASLQKEGGFYVKEEGKLVAYKMMDGREWYIQTGRASG